MLEELDEPLVESEEPLDVDVEPSLLLAEPRGTAGLGRVAAVVAVETAALEDHAHLAEQLAQPSVALGAYGQRIVAERLDLVEPIVTSVHA